MQDHEANREILDRWAARLEGAGVGTAAVFVLAALAPLPGSTSALWSMARPFVDAVAGTCVAAELDWLASAAGRRALLRRLEGVPGSADSEDAP